MMVDSVLDHSIKHSHLQRVYVRRKERPQNLPQGLRPEPVPPTGREDKVSPHFTVAAQTCIAIVKCTWRQRFECSGPIIITSSAHLYVPPVSLSTLAGISGGLQPQCEENTLPTGSLPRSNVEGQLKSVGARVQGERVVAGSAAWHRREPPWVEFGSQDFYYTAKGANEYNTRV